MRTEPAGNEHRVAATLLTGPVASLATPADFERVLSRRPVASSPHFSLHHAVPEGAELSTGLATAAVQPVESLLRPASGGWRLGLVVPKRHARRAVTRNLVKRQARTAMQHHLSRLPAGDWVVRLRTPFARAQFPSAASSALKQVVRAELAQLFGTVAAATSR